MFTSKKENTTASNRRTNGVAPAVLGLVVLIAWQGVCVVWSLPPWLLPSPIVIAKTVISRWDALWANALVTIPVVLLGFGSAFIAGIVVAIVMRASPLAAKAIYPWLLVNQTVPTIAVAPVLVTWFGFTLQAKLIIVALICFFPICVNAVDGFKAADPEKIQLLRTLGATRRRIFWEVEVPSALPHVLSGMKVAASVSVVAAVMSEWVGSSRGLGHFIQRSASQLATAQVFAALALLAMMGIALFGVVVALERWLMAWRTLKSPQSRVGKGRSGSSP